MNDDQRCETCAFWREFDLEWGKPESGGAGHGECERIGNGYQRDRTPRAWCASAHTLAIGFRTMAEFGCVEHRPKGVQA